MNSNTQYHSLAMQVAQHFAALDAVTAVVLAGSIGTGAADDRSDIDCYIYADSTIPVETRTNIAAHFADVMEIGNAFWEPGDEWSERTTQKHIDITYRTPQWIAAQLARILDSHEASVGYSTCFWHNVRASTALFDRTGWYQQLQEQATQPYPEPLRKAIIAKNYPILRDAQSSYSRQIALALARRDNISVHHRVAALLASYFDILFAVNRWPHPGEKRMLAFAQHHCQMVPGDMESDILRVLDATNRSHAPLLPERLTLLLDHLDNLLRQEHLLP